MIAFIQKDKRKYDIVNGTRAEGNVDSIEIHSKICSLDLVFSPATNKFDKIVEFVEDCSLVLGEEFDTWFNQYISEYVNSNYDAAIIKQHIPRLIEITDKYIEAKNICFEDYIDLKKVSSNSIFFDSEEIKKLIQVSNYLKLYFIISQDNEMKLPVKFHREVYNILIHKISTEILFKLFKIVSSKTYRYTVTDNYMWEYIRLIYCKTTDMHIHTIFNFLLNNILATCQTDQNPIPFMISVIDESIRWILQSVYDVVIIYTDTINTEDINALQGKDNLLSYAYNDTIGRLVLAAQKCLEPEGIDEVKFNESIKSSKEISLISTYVTFPIMSKVLDIPYRHFSTISAEHGYLLNVLLYHILPADFKEEFPTICEFLLNYNKNRAIIKTTYRLKNADEFYESFSTFKGFKCFDFPMDFYASVVGKIARNEYSSLKNQQEVSIPLAKLESDIIKLYNAVFGENMDEFLKDLEGKIDKLL